MLKEFISKQTLCRWTLWITHMRLALVDVDVGFVQAAFGYCRGRLASTAALRGSPHAELDTGPRATCLHPSCHTANVRSAAKFLAAGPRVCRGAGTCLAAQRWRLSRCGTALGGICAGIQSLTKT
ncbi:hypothetical protein VOLCADRAFT_99501 [Volvox carteri f. nagariensis]|uniref:Uncharacterized protein n=1 Tax=Volvox carteri f. nagariensis TaxID=3068 RepID=D8UHY3_VOLCA|nr:uncharacterized protein VOLCADRAFT_99501 [Volvox carteri f. nagariensis]EFJ40662.1 hypothetical protein VOLCADRAFT_99501 [Volvox carteri f. nagariensis]|eukprot:XP_002958288.1 hypothetical protein VOLCADRAFT_99501 [Volvox carteri f. nagariensis]